MQKNHYFENYTIEIIKVEKKNKVRETETKPKEIETLRNRDNSKTETIERNRNPKKKIDSNNRKKLKP